MFFIADLHMVVPYCSLLASCFIYDVICRIWLRFFFKITKSSIFISMCYKIDPQLYTLTHTLYQDIPYYIHSHIHYTRILLLYTLTHTLYQDTPYTIHSHIHYTRILLTIYTHIYIIPGYSLLYTQTHTLYWRCH